MEVEQVKLWGPKYQDNKTYIFMSIVSWQWLTCGYAMGNPLAQD